MPVLFGASFQPQKNRVKIKGYFPCKSTGEYFKTYEQFFERQLQCREKKWKSAFNKTEKMTFDEAKEKEDKIIENLIKENGNFLKSLINLIHFHHFDHLLTMKRHLYRLCVDHFFNGEIVCYGEKKIFRWNDKVKTEILERLPSDSETIINYKVKNELKNEFVTHEKRLKRRNTYLKQDFFFSLIRFISYQDNTGKFLIDDPFKSFIDEDENKYRFELDKLEKIVKEYKKELEQNGDHHKKELEEKGNNDKKELEENGNDHKKESEEKKKMGIPKNKIAFLILDGNFIEKKKLPEKKLQENKLKRKKLPEKKIIRMEMLQKPESRKIVAMSKEKMPEFPEIVSRIPLDKFDDCFRIIQFLNTKMKFFNVEMFKEDFISLRWGNVEEIDNYMNEIVNKKKINHNPIFRSGRNMINNFFQIDDKEPMFTMGMLEEALHEKNGNGILSKLLVFLLDSILEISDNYYHDFCEKNQIEMVNDKPMSKGISYFTDNFLFTKFRSTMDKKFAVRKFKASSNTVKVCLTACKNLCHPSMPKSTIWRDFRKELPSASLTGEGCDPMCINYPFLIDLLWKLKNVNNMRVKEFSKHLTQKFNILFLTIHGRLYETMILDSTTISEMIRCYYLITDINGCLPGCAINNKSQYQEEKLSRRSEMLKIVEKLSFYSVYDLSVKEKIMLIDDLMEMLLSSHNFFKFNDKQRARLHCLEKDLMEMYIGERKRREMFIAKIEFEKNYKKNEKTKEKSIQLRNESIIKFKNFSKKTISLKSKVYRLRYLSAIEPIGIDRFQRCYYLDWNSSSILIRQPIEDEKISWSFISTKEMFDDLVSSLDVKTNRQETLLYTRLMDDYDMYQEMLDYCPEQFYSDRNKFRKIISLEEDNSTRDSLIESIKSFIDELTEHNLLSLNRRKLKTIDILLDDDVRINISKMEIFTSQFVDSTLFIGKLDHSDIEERFVISQKCKMIVKAIKIIVENLNESALVQPMNCREEKIKNFTQFSLPNQLPFLLYDCLENWMISLSSVTSYSQIALHLQSLKRSLVYQHDIWNDVFEGDKRRRRFKIGECKKCGNNYTIRQWNSIHCSDCDVDNSSNLSDKENGELNGMLREEKEDGNGVTVSIMNNNKKLTKQETPSKKIQLKLTHFIPNLTNGISQNMNKLENDEQKNEKKIEEIQIEDDEKDEDEDIIYESDDYEIPEKKITNFRKRSLTKHQNSSMNNQPTKQRKIIQEPVTICD
ncbi:hypothetical protein SNEBB_000374 [Seison nebaliae]|nr:hypothetical protein SNEBB_000374 [Seison nebaliae]